MLQSFTGTDTAYTPAKKGNAPGHHADNQVVCKCGDPDDGDLRKCRTARPVQFAQPLSREAGAPKKVHLPDLLLVDGNPIDDITLVVNPDKNLISA